MEKIKIIVSGEFEMKSKTIKCDACGLSGHLDTSKICPLYNETLQSKMETLMSLISVGIDSSLQSWVDKFKKLKLDEQDILLKHVKLSGKIQKMINIRNHLIELFHANKGVKKKIKWHFSNDTTQKYYKSFLFHGQNVISGFDKFPSYFYDRLEEVLFKEMPENAHEKQINLICVYYSNYFHRNCPLTLFDKEEWKVEKCSHMTEQDIKTLKKFIKELLDTLDECLFVLTNDRCYQKCKKERDRIEKASLKV